MSVVDKITDLETFLAYSIALEEEAADQHEELADALHLHHNDKVAETFRKLARYSRLHAREIREQGESRTLPVIAPWDFGWEEAVSPETADIENVSYLMNTAQALQIAMGNEQRAHDFYDQVSRESRIPEVAAMAAEFAAEEQEHLELLREWMAKTKTSVDEELFDTDPVNMP
jgi:rubrerythrin